MPIKNNGNVVINSTQRTTNLLEFDERFNDIDFTAYIFFGKALRRKNRRRVIVNPVRGLQNTRDKLTQHRLLRDAQIKKPAFLRNRQEAEHFLRNNPDKKIVAKRTNHSRGRGMYRIENLDALYNVNPIVFDENQYYFEEFVECNREWRVHVSQFQEDEVVAYRKCLRQEYIDEWRKTEAGKPWIRNMDTCYYKADSEEDKKDWWNDIVAECKRGIEVLGIDIAGCDVGENTRTGEFYIYEINSACGLGESSREAYSEAIETIIEAKARQKGYL